MSGIVRRLEWDRQPASTPRLGPDFAGVTPVFYVPTFGAVGCGVVEGSRGTLTDPFGEYQQIVTPLGVGERNTTSGSNAKRDFPGATLSVGYTLIAYFFDRVGRGSFRSLFDSDADELGGNRTFQFRVNTSDNLEFIAFNTARSPFFASTAAATRSDGLNVGICRVDAFGVMVSTLNGVSVVGQTVSGTLQTVASWFTFAQYAGAAATPFRDAILGAGVVCRYLSDAETDDLCRAPWRLFEPEQIYVPFASGGGAAALAGAATSGATATGALTTAIQAAASVSASASVTAALSTGIRPAASVSASAAVSAALTTAIQMAGSLSATASVTGDISGAAALASSVSTSAIVTGDLTTAIRLNASVSGAATVTGVLAEPGVAAALEASIAASATVGASLTGGSSSIWTPASASSGTWTPASAAGGTWVAQ